MVPPLPKSKRKFKKLVAKKLRTVKPQSICRSKPDWTYIDSDYKIYDEKGVLKGIFLKNVIPEKIVKIGREELPKYTGKTSLRMASAGYSHTNVLKNGTKIKMANIVESSVVGYYEKSNFFPCRQTALYKKNEKDFNKNLIKLIQFISNTFKKYCKKYYDIQHKYINSINKHMRLKDTVYSTLTVNKDFRTRAHFDKGDYAGGLSNLAVFNTGNFTGAELLCPEFKLAFNVQEGDLIFFDSHYFLHCNNPIKGKGRISLVCYIREKIKKRCKGVTKKAILNAQKLVRDKSKYV